MQGRFKRDGSASGEPEPHGGTDRGSSPQHGQSPGPAPAGAGADRPDVKAVDAPEPTPSAQPGSTGSRMALRNWRISTRLVSLLALPVVAATTLGGMRISENMDQIQQLESMKLLTDMTRQATQLAAALQEERDQTAGPLAHGATSNDYTVKGAREKTDRARSVFIQGTGEIGDAAEAGQLSGVRDSVVGIAGELNNLSTIRANAYKDPKNSAQTVEAYHRLITQLLSLSQDMAQATSNPEMIQRTRSLAAFSTAKEYASMQRAVIAAALPANNSTEGKLSENDRQYALSALESQDSSLDSFASIYGEEAAELTKPIDQGSPTIEAADKYADRVLKSSNGFSGQNKRSYKDWVDDDSAKILQMKSIEGTLLEEMEQKARELKNSSQQEAIISGALILLVLGVSLVGAFVVARSMIRSLRRLQDTATKVAQDRLPQLVKELSESDPQDVDTSVESVGVHSRDEIGQVAAAFDDVHREAVRLAAEQALLRGNVNAMFTNLSRRSQGLIQRQLSLISELESREADPDQLSSLFKLDHLATRMRRNGENLLVLAGEEPGRRWTRPVPLVDVLRAAASEVEQYERIELAAVPATEVAGRVVNDLVHLLAELLENATSFSSPQTKVKVTGHALPDGRVLIEIHDTGIGLSPEDLAQINERLAAPPTVDVSVSRRMGLFVVGRLSQRHGIRIQLRPSDSGGTTALVMLPVDVAQGGKKPAGKQGQGGPQSGGSAAGAAAAGAAAARRQVQGGGAGGPGLKAAPQRGQVGAGQGPRAALPGSGQNGRPGGPGGSRGQQGGAGGAASQAPTLFEQGGRPSPQQGRQNPAAGDNAFGQQQAAPGAPQGLQAAQAFPNNGAPVPPQQQERKERQEPQRKEGRGGRRRPQLPGRGGPRAELPGGNQQQRTPSWSDENAQPPAPRAALDGPRGHEEPDALSATSQMPRIDDHQGPGATAEIPRIEDDRQGPGSTAEFARPDFNAPRPGAGGQFPRQDGFGGPQQQGNQAGGFPGAQQAQDTGRFPASGHQETGQFPALGRGQDTGQFANPGHGQDTGQYPAQRHDGSGTGQFAAPGQGQDTGQYQAPGRGRGAGRFQGPGQDSGQFPNTGHAQDTGQFAAPEHGQDTGQFQTPQQGQGANQFQGPGQAQDTGQFQTPEHGQDTGQFQAPGHGQHTGQFQVPEHGQDTGQFQAPGQGQNTGQFANPGHGQGTGQYPAQRHDGSGTGQFAAPGYGDPSATGQFDAQGHDASGTGQFAAQGYGNQQDPSATGQFAQAQQQAQQQAPQQSQQPEALPPAQSAGDGRTPLFDRLETNWFHGERGQQNDTSAAQAPQQQPAAPEPSAPEPSAPERPAPAAWRTSPNDEIGRAAERVRQPSAGGVTTSGLPRRVPRANLVPGTAQQQQHHTGPQVSRAPDDVRGRLTNLRRGIAQGRQAGTGQTGSFPSPTHQQEQ
ncbi:nitrate- and nitrite sensing domain-containing protein [Streptomyces sp. RY43-2]|uniref:histidine kinase n=1 Tax=Streptomyces macrolidinus TaxID=2952607 RepID=A0ABT0ZGZ1_9ACTN|nr:nitrate- and nitrite sensing domain-containing protein [Streptomyces macrolidinus]MCN9242848.1 nitrate- and nitrite sensing domain-containing protein [Streptomyces macrolidinus]